MSLNTALLEEKKIQINNEEFESSIMRSHDTYYVDTISDLKSLTSTPKRVFISGYYSAQDNAFGSLYHELLPDDGSVYVEVAGIVVKSASGRYYKLKYKTLYPEYCGTVGDGVVDDTNAIKSLVSLGKSFKTKSGKKYRILERIEINPKDSYFTIDGEAEFVFNTETDEIFRGFYIRPYRNMKFIGINGIDIDGKSKTTEGIFIYVDVRYTVELINVQLHNIRNMNNITNLYSTYGIHIKAKNSKLIRVADGIVDNINRNLNNAGNIASVGIGLNTNGKVVVHGNKISNVLSGAGQADADALQIFSSNSSTSGTTYLTTNGSVYDNEFLNCRGRFVKLQTPNIDVYRNEMKIKDFETFGGFIFIDAQKGGVDASNNNMYIENELSGGEMHPIALGGSCGAGEVNSIQEFSMLLGNKLYSDRYTATEFITADFQYVNHAEVIAKNNKVIMTGTDTAISANFIFIALPDDDPARAIKNINIVLSGNEYPLNNTSSGRFVAISDKSTAIGQYKIDSNKNKWSLEISNNKNTNSAASGEESALYIRNEFYAQNILLKDNTNMNAQYLRVNGMDAKKLPVGTSFRFAYGSLGNVAGGNMAGVPSGYEAICHITKVDNNFIEITTSAASKTAKLIRSNDAWYEYLGTLVT